MKTFLIAGAVALATVVAPHGAFAQDTAVAGDIIVTGQYERDWNRGNVLEAQGLKDLQKAQRELVKYSAAVVNAQDLRDTSQERADNARASFEKLTSRPFIGAAEEARKWAKQVEAAASDWEKFEARRDEGADDLRKAQKRQVKAQTSVDQAQAKVDEGKAMKAHAEAASRAQSRV